MSSPETSASPAANTYASMRETQLIKAILSRPEDISLSLAMGEFLLGQERNQDAAAVYRDILDRDPDHSVALYKLGNVLYLYPAFQDEGIELLQRAIAIDPSVIDAYRPLAWSLDHQSRRAEATEVLRQWCAVAPLDPVAAHFLAAHAYDSPPDRAADAFVQATFDKTADKFDRHLRDVLQYRAPEVLSAHLDPLLPVAAKGALDVLDMGCGTGLCAPFLRPWARQLTGVDLSSGMLAKARATGGYDVLEGAELTAYLDQSNRSGATFDLLFAADTLVYFGRLDGLFAQSFSALAPGGWIAFTVERLAEELVVGGGPAAREWMLDTTGRYKHGAHYVNDGLTQNGFVSIQVAEAQVRVESGAPVIALVVAAMKPR